VRAAAQDTHVLEFVIHLPQEYEKPVGENTALISGEQARSRGRARF
jgi:ABC-type multidrug transport system fused ATPase/permease subunit